MVFPFLTVFPTTALSFQAVQNLIKNHSSFEKLLGVQDEKLKSISDFGDKLVQEGNFDSDNIKKRINEITGEKHDF